jgi:CRISPR-associated protein Csm4
MEHIVFLKPRSPFHIGEAGVGLEETSVTVHSDTLFSALCNMYTLLYGRDDLEALLKEFQEEPPFQVSSGFLYGPDILTFPVPLDVDWLSIIKDGLLEELGKTQTELLKDLRSVQYVSERVFMSILSKRSEDISLPPVQGVLLSQDETLPEKIYDISETPRVALDRRSETSAIYHVGEVFYNQDCGLYFFLKTTPKYDKRIRACINLLGDEGLGGKRSSGRGLFRPVIKESSVRVPQSSRKVTLSLTFPKVEELPAVKEGLYTMIPRRGWVSTPEVRSLRKKGVRMLAEGSTFTQEVKGQLANVAPDSMPSIPCIIRYGLGYYLPEGEGHGSV